MKHKVRLNMYDAYTKATDSRDMEVTDKELKEVEYYIANSVIITELANNINWYWIIEEVEILETITS